MKFKNITPVWNGSRAPILYAFRQNKFEANKLFSIYSHLMYASACLYQFALQSSTLSSITKNVSLDLYD